MSRFLARHGRFAFLVMLITALPMLSKIGWWVVTRVVSSLVLLVELQLIILDRGVWSALIIASLMSLDGYSFFFAISSLIRYRPLFFHLL